MRVYLIVLISVLSACSRFEPILVDDVPSPSKSDVQQEEHCSNEWFRYVEGQLGSRDHQGHGPDIGSMEWKSVIEFKLGLIKHPTVPDKSTSQWCDYIQQTLDERRSVPVLACQGKFLSEMTQQVCTEPELTKLDHEMNKVFKLVLTKLSTENRTSLKAQQRQWINHHEQCASRSDHSSCLRERYLYRTAELQTRHGLIEGLGPIYYVCDGELTDEVAVRFFPTEPPSVIAERGGKVAFMTLQVSASGAKYQGLDTEFWEHQGNAYITWGAGATMMNCKKMH